MSVISIDDPSTWPTDVFERVEARASVLAGTTEHTLDLGIDPNEDVEFRAVLTDHLLTVYHATRLLDHEIEWMWRDGLVPLSNELVRRRIEAARDSGYITANDRDELLRGNLFAADRRTASRENQVCFLLSRRTLDQNVSGIWHLLTTWGGEGIYLGRFSTDVEAHLLRKLGSPAIVVAAIPLAEDSQNHHVSPGVLKAFVGRQLELSDYGASVLYRAAVPSRQIVDVWLPGHPQYDRHTALPRD